MDTQSTVHGKLAAEFAAALVAGRFDEAHNMLCASARNSWPVAALEEAYAEMVGYFESPPTLVQVMEVMTDWPDKKPQDIGWAYTAIAGDDESEAVTVVIKSENGANLIRSIEWGRP